MPPKIALLASGRGSNVRAILSAIRDGRLRALPVCVLTNREDAAVIQIAREFDVPVEVVPHQDLSREAHDARVLDALSPYQPEWLVMAGYMRLVTPTLLKPFVGPLGYQVVNIHPSLLPAFPGVDAYRQAYEYGVKTTGVTVHLVDEQMDHGPILHQASFMVTPEMTLADVEATGLALEHQIYPEVLSALFAGAFERGARQGRPCIQRKVSPYAAC